MYEIYINYVAYSLHPIKVILRSMDLTMLQLLTESTNQVRAVLDEQHWDITLARIQKDSLGKTDACKGCGIKTNEWTHENTGMHVDCLPCVCGRPAPVPRVIRMSFDGDGDRYLNVNTGEVFTKDEADTDKDHVYIKDNDGESVYIENLPGEYWLTDHIWGCECIMDKSPEERYESSIEAVTVYARTHGSELADEYRAIIALYLPKDHRTVLIKDLRDDIEEERRCEPSLPFDTKLDSSIRENLCAVLEIVIEMDKFMLQKASNGAGLHSVDVCITCDKMLNERDQDKLRCPLCTEKMKRGGGVRKMDIE